MCVCHLGESLSPPPNSRQSCRTYFQAKRTRRISRFEPNSHFMSPTFSYSEANDESASFGRIINSLSPAERYLSARSSSRRRKARDSARRLIDLITIANYCGDTHHSLISDRVRSRERRRTRRLPSARFIAPKRELRKRAARLSMRKHVGAIQKTDTNLPLPACPVVLVAARTMSSTCVTVHETSIEN